MAALAVDGNVVGTVGEVVAHAAGLVERLAVLVEPGDLEPGAEPHPAPVRLELAQQQPDQGGLAGTVGADDADPVAAQDAGGEVADEGAAAETVAQAFGLDDELSAALGCGQFHAHAALPLAPPTPFLAHGLQCPHAPLVARAPRLDALPDPGLLARQVLVELGVGAGLGFQFVGLAPQVVGVVSRVAAQAATVEFDDARGEAVDEAAVVGDEQQGAGPVEQEVLQPFDGGDVEVVGGFVEQQQVRLAGQGAAQQHAPAQPAGEGLDAGPAIQAETGQHLIHPLAQCPAARRLDAGLGAFQCLQQACVVGPLGQPARQFVMLGEEAAGLAQALGNDVIDRALDALRHLLRQPGRAQPLAADDLAVVRFVLAGDQAQQRRLAGAVAADQAQALAGCDAQIGPVEQGGGAEGQVHGSQFDEIHAPIVRQSSTTGDRLPLQ